MPRKDIKWERWNWIDEHVGTDKCVYGNIGGREAHELPQQWTVLSTPPLPKLEWARRWAKRLTTPSSEALGGGNPPETFANPLKIGFE